MISFNVHQLLHLTEAVSLHECLEKYSGFPFESKLGEIKNRICSGNFPLEQAAKRTMEQLKVDIEYIKISLKNETSIKIS